MDKEKFEMHLENAGNAVDADWAQAEALIAQAIAMESIADSLGKLTQLFGVLNGEGFFDTTKDSLGKLAACVDMESPATFTIRNYGTI